MTISNTKHQIIFRGDDAGMSVSANRAIVQCHRQGVLRNTSVMAVGAELEDAARRFSECDELCIGLHVTLNSEWTYPRYRPILPADQVPTLVDDDGFFLPTPMHQHQRGLVITQAVAEVRAQLHHLRCLGLQPAYMDEHMGVGWLNDGRLRNALLELAQSEGLIPAEKDHAMLPKCDPHTSNDEVEMLIERIRHAPAGRYVFITHPLFDDDENRKITNAATPPGLIAQQRNTDRLLLIDPRLIAFCRAENVQPLRYTDALSMNAQRLFTPSGR